MSEQREPWRFLTAATVWDSPAVEPNEELLWTVESCRRVCEWGDGTPIEAAMNERTAALFRPNIDRAFGKLVLDKTVKSGRIILTPLAGGGKDVWVQVLA